jgi:hypothetical protein
MLLLYRKDWLERHSVDSGYGYDHGYPNVPNVLLTGHDTLADIQVESLSQQGSDFAD